MESCRFIVVIEFQELTNQSIVIEHDLHIVKAVISLTTNHDEDENLPARHSWSTFLRFFSLTHILAKFVRQMKMMFVNFLKAEEQRIDGVPTVQGSSISSTGGPLSVD